MRNRKFKLVGLDHELVDKFLSVSKKIIQEDGGMTSDEYLVEYLETCLRSEIEFQDELRLDEDYE